MHRKQGLEVCPYCAGIHTSYPFDCREKGKPWPKPNEYFSDEEIAEAKEKYPKGDRIHALLARLEAAEKVADMMYSMPPIHPDDGSNKMIRDAQEAWRKAAGE
jgi:hypothetical protein